MLKDESELAKRRSFVLPPSRLEDPRFKFANLGIKGGGFEGPDQGVAGVGGIDDGVDPQAGGGGARRWLVFVGRRGGFDLFFFLFFFYFFVFSLALFHFLFSVVSG